MKRVILIGALLLTTGCVTRPDGGAVTQRYMCADGTAFFARYRPAVVVLDFGGGATKALAAQPDAGPGVYGAGVYGVGGDAFRASDYWASLVLGGRPPVICRRGDVRDLAVIN